MVISSKNPTSFRSWSVKSYHKLREFLADIEHTQWISWSKSLSQQLLLIKDLFQRKSIEDAVEKIDSILLRWEKNWKPYNKLPEHIKDSDREWADKILDSIPIRCPVFQCGGFMQTKERKLPKGFIESEHYDGDEQTPDLICTNCDAIYQFKGFKK